MHNYKHTKKIIKVHDIYIYIYKTKIQRIISKI